MLVELRRKRAAELARGLYPGLSVTTKKFRWRNDVAASKFHLHRNANLEVASNEGCLFEVLKLVLPTFITYSSGYVFSAIITSTLEQYFRRKYLVFRL